MDFVKAFDKVSHRHQLTANYSMAHGVNNNALHWIGDFLDQPTQTFVLGDKCVAIPLRLSFSQEIVMGFFPFLTYNVYKCLPGPSCSKLTTLLVNDSLKFKSSDTQIR